MSKKYGPLFLALNAILVGGGGLLEHGSKLSVLSVILGVGLGILLYWFLALAEHRFSKNEAITEERA